jgi:hypothetical protein
MFKITNVYRSNDDTVKVSVQVNSKYWTKLKNKGDLGSLYGVDISNEVFRTYGVQAYNPTVSANKRCRMGFKWVHLYYTDTTWIDPADAEYSKQRVLDELSEKHADPSHNASLRNSPDVSNVIHVDFQLGRHVVGPVLPLKPIDRDIAGNMIPCDVIKYDFINKRRAA